MFVNAIKERAVLCSLDDLYNAAVALVFMTDINDLRIQAYFLELKNFTVYQALFIARKHIRIAAEHNT